jgi:hypothetical protein
MLPVVPVSNPPLSRRVGVAAPSTSKLDSNARKVGKAAEALVEGMRKKKHLEDIRVWLPAIAVAWNQH